MRDESATRAFNKMCFSGWSLEKCEAIAEAVAFFEALPNRQATRGQVMQAGKSVRSTVGAFGSVGSFPNFLGRRIGDNYVYELITTPAAFMPELKEVISEKRKGGQ